MATSADITLLSRNLLSRRWILADDNPASSDSFSIDVFYIHL